MSALVLLLALILNGGVTASDTPGGPSVGAAAVVVVASDTPGGPAVGM